MSTQEEYEAILEKMPVTKIHGAPTMQSYEALIEELQPIAKRLKNSIFPGGREYGCMPLICEDSEYGSYIDNEEYYYQDPVPPEEHVAAQVQIGLNEVQREANKETLKRYTADYTKIKASENVLRNAIVTAVEEEWIEALKKPVIKYDAVAPYDLLLKQIRSEILLTTVERTAMKATVFTPWDNTTTLRSYANQIDQSVQSCQRWKILIIPQDVIDHFVGQIYDNKTFEQKIMMDWESKKAAIKTWSYCKTYFLKHAADLKNYDKSTGGGARKAGYHSARNVEEIEENESAEMEENVNIVLDAMERNSEQMNQVAATNVKLEATIEEMSKQITRLLEMNA